MLPHEYFETGRFPKAVGSKGLGARRNPNIRRIGLNQKAELYLPLGQRLAQCVNLKIKPYAFHERWRCIAVANEFTPDATQAKCLMLSAGGS